MLGKTLSVGVYGIDGYPVKVEFDVRAGLPAVVVVGLPDATAGGHVRCAFPAGQPTNWFR